jgi:regulator of sigma E protease
MLSLIYFIFAILGLGFLIFIHELGHYWMARRQGMRVESFGIGFGKPIYTFKHDGVNWNICWLPFGGYVKIAGMEKEGEQEPHEVKDGFFGKSPWARIKVSIMGPLANLVFAFLIFCILWVAGGREKNFSDVTKKLGWIDPQSELYKNGIRPGDEILFYDSEPVRGAKDHFQAAMTGGDLIHVKGRRFDTKTNSYVPFALNIHPYPHPLALEQGILTTGVLAPASYIIYAELPRGMPNPLPKGSPLEGSGIEYGDRIVWADGDKIYSLGELTHILNEGRALATVRRGNDVILRRIPRVAVEDLKLENEQKEELTDWQWEANLKNTKLNKLYFIPYNLNADNIVESQLKFIDPERELAAFPKVVFSDKEEALLPGDQIIAIDGTKISSAPKLLKDLQARKVQLIVEGKDKVLKPELWTKADEIFDKEVNLTDLAAIEETIGTDSPLKEKGNLKLLKPITPKTRSELLQDKNPVLTTELEEEKKQIQAIDDPQKRQEALKFLEKREKQLLIGLPGVQDMPVTYNPNPVVLFQEIAEEVANTLTALVGGFLNPKWLSGPIGIVQVIHQHWMLGIKEALFWLGIISLNLGLLNLLPLPVLDGGYICLSLFEILTGTRLKAKTIEKIIVPFAILLIAFLIFLTYHDIARLLGNLLGG